MASMAIDILSTLVAIACILYTYFKWSFSYWKRKNVPYLEPSIPFGNLQSPFDKSRVSLGSHISNLYRQAREKGYRHCGVYFFNRALYMPTDPNLLKNVLQRDFNYFVDRGFYYNESKDPLGAHLFAIGGSKWRNLRRKLTPTFTSGKIKAMFKTVIDCGLILEKVMARESANNNPVDIKEVMGRFTTDIIGCCAFGLDCNTFQDEESPFRLYGKKIASIGENKFEFLMVAISHSFPKLGRALGLRQLSKDVSDFFSKVVKDNIDYREENNIVRKDFFQILMEMKSKNDESEGDGNSLTFNEIAAQCVIFFLAGFDTSSTTMTFALYNMSRNQEVQEKVRDEINRVLAKHGGEITYEALNDMHYMGQVIEETLRLHPPVPVITRVCVKDYKVEGEDVIIQKGTKVVIPIMGIHHDEKNYPDAETFDPERFNLENKASRDPFTYIPFGEGNRICIGLRFGVLQTKVGLTVLLKNYKFSLSKIMKDEKITYDPSAFLLNTTEKIYLDCQKI
ncbi:unnamed protein product [Brassicogethes aeneus]|uniref:Cytochrome P450 n=1 Tax=Brassicogethes aeneus TaxID=1431903 RepID=A0A9P0AS14_BRAAE|nr:unnamed protein product [Brassicogethes aeneus]